MNRIKLFWQIIFSRLIYIKRYRRFFCKSVVWSWEQQKNFQLQQLKDLICYAYKHVPYYKTTFNARNLQIDILLKSLNADMILSALPFLEKESLRKNPSNFVSNEINSLVTYVRKTSGSTGASMKVVFDFEAMVKDGGFLRWYYNFIGMPNGPIKKASFGGTIIVPPGKEKPPFWKHKFFSRAIIMSTYHMSDKFLQHYVEKLNKFKPLMLIGYPSAICILAKYILRNKIKLKFTPKAIVCTAETLREHYYKTIEKAFHCKLYNQYASSEGSPFIVECPYGKLHPIPGTGIFEFINMKGEKAKPGEMAELVVTSFRNKKTPLIRYRIGDYVQLPVNQSDCPCGLKTIIVEKILGREDDLLLTPSGKMIGIAGHHLLASLPNIENSQLIQHSLNNLELVIVKGKEYVEKEIEENILQRVNEVFGNEMNFLISYVNSIPLGKNGKHRSVIRKFPINDQKF